MRNGTGWSLHDAQMQAVVSGVCDVCGKRFYKHTSHDAVLYSQARDQGQRMSIAKLPSDHMIVFCYPTCYTQWLQEGKLRYLSSD